MIKEDDRDLLILMIALKILEDKIFGDREHVIVHKEGFEDTTIREAFITAGRTVEAMKFIEGLGAPSKVAYELALGAALMNIDDKMSSEDHNCDMCPNAGSCPLEEQMRMINKKEVTVDKNIDPEVKPSKN